MAVAVKRIKKENYAASIRDTRIVWLVAFIGSVSRVYTGQQVGVCELVTMAIKCFTTFRRRDLYYVEITEKPRPAGVCSSFSYGLIHLVDYKPSLLHCVAN